jgi:hypothetical protein
MKSIKFSAFLIGVTVLISIPTAEAIPLYYTFEGKRDGPCCCGTTTVFQELTGLTEDDLLSYVFLVDDNIPTGSGEFEAVEREGIIQYYFSYQTTLISGTGLDVDNGNTSAYMLGFFRYGPGLHFYDSTLYLSGSADNGGISIYGYPFIPLSSMYSYENFTQYLIDNPLRAGDVTLRLANDQGSEPMCHLRVTLTSITEKNPLNSVPEPSLFYLIGAGMIGIATTCRKKVLSWT